MLSFLSRLTGGSRDKPLEMENTLRIFSEENSYNTVKKDEDMDCSKICLQLGNRGNRRSENPEYRIILVVSERKDVSKIICKRILNGFERPFEGYFAFPRIQIDYKFYMVDVQEYLLRQQYVPLQISNREKQQKNIRIETEGNLEMRQVGQKEFTKQKFILTPEVLIYHSPGQKDRIMQILLLYIERIYINPNDGSKTSDLTFYIKTTNIGYEIKCKSLLDKNVWIKQLIHFTNLAKERNIIQDINKKITQIKIFKFESETNNSFFIKDIVFKNKTQMLKSFELLLKHHDKFFENCQNSKAIATFVKIVGVLINEIYTFKQMNILEQGRNKVNELYRYIHEQKERVLELSQLGWNNLSLRTMQEEDIEPEEKFDSIFKFSTDLFSFLQRLSVSKNILLEEYYQTAEEQHLNSLTNFIVQFTQD